VQEHLQRLNANMTKHSVNTAERAGATAIDAFNKANRSHIEKSNLDRSYADNKDKPLSDENKRRVVETSNSNNYQLVVKKDDDLMRMTGHSYMQQTVTANELDNFHAYEAQK
jgi:hypothetical protein